MEGKGILQFYHLYVFIRINIGDSEDTADTFILNSGSAEVQWQAVGATYWNDSGYLQGAVESFMCGPCLGGTQYLVQVRGIRAGGVTTDWVQVGPYTCSTTTQTIDAADITGMVASGSLPMTSATEVGGAQVDGETITASSGGIITATGTSARLAISSGVSPTGGGVRSARIAVTAPTAGVGATADTTFTWPTAFADADYTLTLTAVAGTGAGVSLAAFDQTATGFTIQATNSTTAASTAIIAHIIAFHD